MFNPGEFNPGEFRIVDKSNLSQSGPKPVLEHDEFFYVVLRDDDSRLVRHKTALEADDEAQRLADAVKHWRGVGKHPRFYVLKVVRVAQCEDIPPSPPVPMTRVSLRRVSQALFWAPDPAGDIPF